MSASMSDFVLAFAGPPTEIQCLIVEYVCRYDVMLARFRDSDPRHVHDSAPNSI